MAIIIDQNTIDYVRLLNDMRRTQQNISPHPDQIPTLPGIDLYVEIRQLHQFQDENKESMVRGVGGDYAAIYNFEYNHVLKERSARALLDGKQKILSELERNKHRVGICIADIPGHEPECVYIASRLHTAFHALADTDMDKEGQITRSTFGHLNTQFMNRRSLKQKINDTPAGVPLFYGEIYDQELHHGLFRFLSAGYGKPIVYSAEHGLLQKLGDDVHGSDYGPLGLQAWEEHPDYLKLEAVGKRKRYDPGKMTLEAKGDLIILLTDGIDDRGDLFDPGRQIFTETRLQDILREHAHKSAKEITRAIHDSAEEYGESRDDATVAVIKRTT